MDQQGAPNGATDYMVSADSVAPVDGSDVLMGSGSLDGKNGSKGSSTRSSSANDAKRVKLDGGASVPGGGGGGGGGGGNAPSKVIHIRNIPSDVTEAEIIHLGIPFGRVTNVLVLKGKNQAFLEMDDEASASAMVNYFTNCVAQLRERSVYVQFSNHKELKTDQTHSNASASAQAALQAAQALIGQDAQVAAGNVAAGLQGAITPKIQHTASVNGHGASGGANTVLRVIVEHMVYPVTLDVIFQIFSRVGKVLKIVTFTKNNTFQALIQYPDVITAQAAKLSLDGQNIYNGCCTLRIEYSKLSNLNVKYNNDKSRDYTNPALPTGDPTMDLTGAAVTTQASAMLGGGGGHGAAGGLAGAALNAGNLNAIMGLTGNPLAAAYSANQAAVAAAGGMPNPLGAAAQLNQNSLPGFNALNAINSSGAPGTSGLHGAQFLAGAAGANSAAGIQAALGRFAPGIAGQLGVGALNNPMAGVSVGHPNQLSSSCVLLVSNLEENSTQCDHLFTLFGVYGDVHRVKILFNKKDTALIQMAEPHQALLAMNHLDKVKLWGKAMRVMPSKHTQVQLPKEGQPDAGLTKDFSSSSLHRFKKPGSKNYQNIYPPSATLHLSNIPSSVEEDDLRSAFANAGLQVQAFKFFPKDRKMALVQLNSVDDSVIGLIKLHNYQLSETSHLRVSFSKSTI